MKKYFEKTIAWLATFIGKITAIFETIVDGLAVALNRIASDPKELAIVTLIGVIVVDIIFGGKIGVVAFLMTTLTQLFAMIATIKFGSLVIICMLIAIFLTNKK